MSKLYYENNKRIAKNTVLLYIRMLFTMGVTLYTSRIVLSTLGISDYGIYNVVGGVVTMFSFLNGAMASATQRYLNFELGKGNLSKLQSVFNTSLQIHILLSLGIIVLAETIGLWFLLNKMQIPEERLTASLWVYQCSIITAVITILSIPYNAAIIAHEKMSAFAYISVLEVSLKLGIVFLLHIIQYDRLIIYAILVMTVQLTIRICYGFYCKRHFKETQYKHQINKKLIKEMFSFAGWNFIGQLAAILHTQGVNILLNMFFGTIVNAARGIAVQVQMAVLQFCGNFQTALNPQITKTYAQGDIDGMNKLIYRSARFSFFLLFMLALPILLETNIILRIWLNKVPEETVTFLRIMLCTSLIWTFSNPMSTAVQATGKVKRFSIICSSVLLLVVPCSWIILKLDFPPYSVFIVHFVIEFIVQILRTYILKSLIKFSIKQFFYEVCRRVIYVGIIAVIPPFLIIHYMNSGYIRLILTILTSFLSVGISAYIWGLTYNERSFINNKIKAILKKSK